MHVAILDYRATNKIKKMFENDNIKLIDSPCIKDVYVEIQGHSDIAIFKIENTIIYAPNIDEKWITLVNNLFKERNIFDVNLVKGNTHLSDNYPSDVAYNACIIGKNIVCNVKYVDGKIKEVAACKGYNIIHVEQGYSKCSISVIDDNSCITDDKGIAKALKENNIDVLYIEKEDIKLLNDSGSYSNMSGFIGGAMAAISSKIYLFGDINKLKRRDEITEYIKTRNKELVFLEDEDVIDYGSITLI